MILLAARPTSTDSLLRQLATPDGQALLTAAADALEERPQLLARIAELEDRVRQLEAGQG